MVASFLLLHVSKTEINENIDWMLKVDWESLKALQWKVFVEENCRMSWICTAGSLSRPNTQSLI